MHVIIWEYQVRRGNESDFEKIYSPRGEWVELFKRGAGYLGTELLRDAALPQRYVTIDRWESAAAYTAFHQKSFNEYKALDARCAALSESEVLVGAFTPP
jgi:heme-degrading monooxygenase HmoA